MYLLIYGDTIVKTIKNNTQNKKNGLSDGKVISTKVYERMIEDARKPNIIARAHL